MFTRNDVVRNLNEMSPYSREALREYHRSGSLDNIHMNVIRSWKQRDILKNNGHISALGMALVRSMEQTGDGPEGLKTMLGGYR